MSIYTQKPGTLDKTFGELKNGTVITDFLYNNNDKTESVAIDQAGNIVVLGMSDNNIHLARYTNAGILDDSFGELKNGKVIIDFSGGDVIVKTLVIDQAGNIVVAGQRGIEFALARYTYEGIPDVTFGELGNGIVIANFYNDYNVNSVAIDQVGNIVAAGITGGLDCCIVRYTNSGILDESFGELGNGIVVTDFSNNSSDTINSLAIDKGGNIVVAGVCRVFFEFDFVIARYTNSGILDESFGELGNGIVITDFSNNSWDAIYSIAIDNADNIVVTGEVYNTFNNNYSVGLARYTNSGILDESFGELGNGKVMTVFSNNTWNIANSLAIDEAGNIVVTGATLDIDINNYKPVMARYTNAGILDVTFGELGNGKVIIDFLEGSHAKSIAIDEAGNIVLTGVTIVPGITGYSFWLGRYLSRTITQLYLNKDWNTFGMSYDFIITDPSEIIIPNTIYSFYNNKFTDPNTSNSFKANTSYYIKTTKAGYINYMTTSSLSNTIKLYKGINMIYLQTNSFITDVNNIIISIDPPILNNTLIKEINYLIKTSVNGQIEITI